jgi:hypothetical protein
MKLRVIAEAVDQAPIRHGAEALGDLIQFTYELGKSDETTALDLFLAKPSPQAWDRTKWIIDAAIQRIMGVPPDQTTQERLKKWTALKRLSSPVAATAIYDIDMKYARGTPLERVLLSRPLRDKFKAAVGPQGYISALANAGQLPPRKLKKMMQDTAKNSKGLTKAGQLDLPGLRPIKRF